MFREARLNPQAEPIGEHLNRVSDAQLVQSKLADPSGWLEKPMTLKRDPSELLVLIQLQGGWIRKGWVA